MQAQEMADKIKSDPTFNGLDIWVDERRRAVDVNGFHATPDWKATKAKLESLGFSCGPNFGTYQGEVPKHKSIRESYEQMTPEEQARADAAWEKAVRS